MARTRARSHPRRRPGPPPAAGLAGALDQRRGQVVGAGALEVHDQEAEVAGDIGDPQAGVELERVGRPAADRSAANAPPPPGAAVDDEAAPPALHPSPCGASSAASMTPRSAATRPLLSSPPASAFEIVERRAHGGARSAAKTRCRVSSGCCSAPRKPASSAPTARSGWAWPRFTQALGQRVALVVTVHVDGELDRARRVVLGPWPSLPRRAGRWTGAAIERPRETAVEAHLLVSLSLCRSSPRGAQVGEDDRLLDLHPVAGHEDPGAVRRGLPLRRPWCGPPHPRSRPAWPDRRRGPAAISGGRSEASLRANADGGPEGSVTKADSARIRGCSSNCRLRRINRPQERKLVMSRLFQPEASSRASSSSRSALVPSSPGYTGARVQSDLAASRSWGTPDSSIPNQLVNTGTKAEAFAKVMRKHTLEATAARRTRRSRATWARTASRPTTRRVQASTPRAASPSTTRCATCELTEHGADARAALAHFAESVATFAMVMGFALMLVGGGFLVLTLRVLRVFGRRRRRPSLRSRVVRPCSRTDRS